MIVPAVLLASLLYLHGSVQAQVGQKGKPGEAASVAAAQQAAREALAKFENPPKTAKAGKRNWKIRMECLVRLAKAGPAAVPVLLEALKTGSPETRAFAAQALGFLADGDAQPALVHAAAEDKEGLVRVHAIRSLGRLGRLESKPMYRKIVEKDGPTPKFDMTFALTRDDKPDLGAIRKALSSYDLSRIDSACLGQAAPDFALADTTGKTWRLRDLRGKQAVVLVFLQVST
jgi:hypothetical protein